MKKLTLLGVTALLCLLLTAQENTQVKPLTVGDTVPDITFTNLINYPSKTARLSDFKGKLVILDFWHTWCAACAEAMPKMQKLQQQYEGRLQVLLVNTLKTDTAERVKAFFARQKKQSGLQVALPVVIHQDEFDTLFKCEEVPHLVWINKDREITGITGAGDATASLVNKMLDTTGATIYTKRDELRFNIKKPLLVDENGGNEPGNFLYRSIITPYNKWLGSAIALTGVGGGPGEPGRNTDSLKRISIINANLYLLLSVAYSTTIDAGRTFLEISDPRIKNIFEKSNHDAPEYRYSYELITPPVRREQALTWFRQDLERYFAVTLFKEYRELAVYVLAGTESGRSRSYTQNGSPKIKNRPTRKLVNRLQDFLNIPVIDEAAATGAELKLPGNFYSLELEQLEQLLAKNHLKLTPAKRTLEVTVITDHRKNGSFNLIKPHMP